MLYSDQMLTTASLNKNIFQSCLVHFSWICPFLYFCLYVVMLCIAYLSTSTLFVIIIINYLQHESAVNDSDSIYRSLVSFLSASAPCSDAALCA